LSANRYAIVVFWSEEDAAWVADVPGLKSCAAFGNSPEEAFAEVQVAMDA
jgi:predicted RNase H-like HicB family nuclease